MSSTTGTVSAPSATPSVGCGAELYNIPTQDAAVGIPAGGNHTDIMGACCGSADVISYYDGCGLYCLAAGQTIDTLIHCLNDHGALPQDVFYRGTNVSASATATDAPLPTSAAASVVVTHGSSSDPTKSGSDSDSTSSPTNTPNAAAGIRPEFGSVSTLGLTIGALLFSATAFGALQL